MKSNTMPLYEALAHDIKRIGVRNAFGLMSDDTAMLVSTLDAIGVRFFGARHENNAVAMAEGHAAATGELSIAIIGRGPATANAVHALGYVQRAGSKVLLILGDAPTSIGSPNGLGPDGKALNSTLLLEALGLRAFRAVDANTARHTFARAVEAANVSPTAFLLPSNIQHGSVSADPALHETTQISPRRVPRVRSLAISAAADLLKVSRRPLLVAGIGAHRAGAKASILRLADHVGAGVATTLKAQGMFGEYPLDCGILGSFSSARGRRLIEQADCVVVFGASLNQRTTSFGTSLPQDVPIIHIDDNRGNIGRWFHADVAVVADAKQAADDLYEALPARPASEKPFHADEMRRWFRDFDVRSEFEPAPTPRTLDPRSLGIELDAIIPKERNIVYDAGNFLQILQYMTVPGPSNLKHTSDFSSIGMGLGTAMGFACGSPERPTVLFIGDGGFLMNMGELETIAREDIPLIIVLMNDCAYGAEMHFLKLREMPVAASKFPDVDFAPVAESFGFPGATVRSLDDLQALRATLSDPSGPILLDCKINGAIAAPFLLENVENERRNRNAQ